MTALALTSKTACCSDERVRTVATRHFDPGLELGTARLEAGMSLTTLTPSDYSHGYQSATATRPWLLTLAQTPVAAADSTLFGRLPAPSQLPGPTSVEGEPWCGMATGKEAALGMKATGALRHCSSSRCRAWRQAWVCH